METVKITFGDGNEVEAVQNGNCYITEKKIENPDLSSVTILREGSEETIEDAILLEPYSIDGRYWFAFTVQSDDEKMKTEVIKQRGDIDYMAMMLDVDLDTEV